MKENIYTSILLLVTTSILGCATAGGIANKTGFIKEYVKAGDFTLMTYQKFSRNSDRLNIYIEGDGRAWETKYKFSGDPTPLNPLALKLAAEDPADNIAYIARPGQYPVSGIPDCDPKYWSGARFSEEVINSISRAIDLLKEKSAARHVELVGYSGGGAIAVLVAARRNDVISLRTVAGNLDPKAWCRYHRVSQLDGSLDPMDAARSISNIPQRHFTGSKDLVVPGFIVRSFVKQEGVDNDDRITIVEGATHAQGWQERWKELLSMSPL